MKRWYDENAKERKFMTGDRVLAFLPIPGKSLQARFYGPYTVDKQISDVNYIVNTPGRRKQKQLCHAKAVVPVLVLLFVALWFILRGDLLYVFPCVVLFLCFSVLLVLRLPRLGKRELILVLFVRLFGLCLFRFVGFLFLLGSG